MRVLLCLLFVLPTLSSAQSKAPRTCRILFLGAPDSAPETLQLYDGTSSQKVELPRMNLSPVYRLPAGPLVVRMLTAAPARPEEVSPDAPNATISEAVTDFYLLVGSDPANPVAPVKLQVIDADASKFKSGQMLWFNLTPNRIGGQVGSQQLAMNANSRVIVNAPASGNQDYPVNLSFFMPDNERLYPLCETKWLHDPSSRTVFFVVAQEGSRTPRILGFPDHRGASQKDSSP